MKKKYCIFVISFLALLILPSSGTGFTIVQVNRYSNDAFGWQAISGDGSKIFFIGKMFPGDLLGAKILEATSGELLINSIPFLRRGALMDYSGDRMIGGECATYFYSIDYTNGTINQYPSLYPGCGGSVMGCDMGCDMLPCPCYFPFPTMCYSGNFIVFPGSEDGEIPPAGCPECYEYIYIRNLSAGTDVKLDPDNLQQHALSGDCSKVVGVGANQHLVIYSTEGVLLTDLGVKGFVPKMNYDGSIIAFLCEDNGVCSINADGTNLVKHTDFPNYTMDGYAGCVGGNEAIKCNYILQLSQSGDKILINSWQNPQAIFLLDRISGSLLNLTEHYPRHYGGTMSADGLSGLFLVTIGSYPNSLVPT